MQRILGERRSGANLQRRLPSLHRAFVRDATGAGTRVAPPFYNPYFLRKKGEGIKSCRGVSTRPLSLSASPCSVAARSPSDADEHREAHRDHVAQKRCYAASAPARTVKQSCLGLAKRDEISGTRLFFGNSLSCLRCVRAAEGLRMRAAPRPWGAGAFRTPWFSFKRTDRRLRK